MRFCLATVIVCTILGAARVGAQQFPANSKVDQIFAEWDKPTSPGCALGVLQNGRFIYVLESFEYGNATYVFDEDWERLSQMTKAKIAHHHQRLAQPSFLRRSQEKFDVTVLIFYQKDRAVLVAHGRVASP